MLSRIASSLFWIGRYLERSDGTARILDVHLQLLLEDPWVDEDTACRSLLGVMGSPAPDHCAREDVLRVLAVDLGGGLLGLADLLVGGLDGHRGLFLDRGGAGDFGRYQVEGIQQAEVPLRPHGHQ